MRTGKHSSPTPLHSAQVRCGAHLPGGSTPARQLPRGHPGRGAWPGRAARLLALCLAGLSRTACTAQSHAPMHVRAAGGALTGAVPGRSDGYARDFSQQMWSEPASQIMDVATGDHQEVVRDDAALEWYDLDDAEVLGPVSDAEAANFRARAARSLLQRRHARALANSGGGESPPSTPADGAAAATDDDILYRVTVCNRCTVEYCPPGGSGRCSGKCKKGGRLFHCTANRDDPRFCNRRYPWPAATLPADPLDPLSAVVVSTPAPYIPCAEIAGQPAGCPPPGTPHSSDGRNGEQWRHLRSRCRTNRVEIDECQSPFYPFGICECVTSVTLPSGVSNGGPGLCSLSEVDLADLPWLSLSEDGTEVRNAFSRHLNASAVPKYTYSTAVDSYGRDPYNVTLEYFRGFSVLADHFTHVRTVEEDYDAAGADRELDAAAAEDYFNERNFNSDTECNFKCFFGGGGLLGTVQDEFVFDDTFERVRDGYSVVYEGYEICQECSGRTEGYSADYLIFRGDIPDDIDEYGDSGARRASEFHV